jgi:Recombination endonuclease VII
MYPSREKYNKSEKGKSSRKRRNDTYRQTEKGNVAREMGNRKRHANLRDLRDVLLAVQGNKCACCPATEPGSKVGWHVDHDHKTGKVRGVLCHKCNIAIGMAEDNPFRLVALIQYLAKSQY